MRAKAVLSIFCVFLCATITWADSIILDKDIEKPAVTALESDIFRTVVRFDIGSFSREPVEIDGETYYTLALDNEHVLMNPGEPALPRICRSVIIPDYGDVRIRVLSSQYVDIPNTPVAPSKGNVYRDVDPGDIPYSFSDVYSSDGWFPAGIASVREPYILRDYRGTVIEFYPFQYNPATRTLRAYTSVTVEVVADDKSGAKALGLRDDDIKLVPEFDQLYARRFINYETAQVTYTSVIERGDMLIITHDDFHAALTAFVDWKRQKGIKTTIIDVSTIGNNPAAIKAFIQDFYDSTELAWVLLVGDADEVATPFASGGSSDPSYAKLAGGDDYPDAFVGRFSAESLADVETQIERTLTYEQNPPGSGWFSKGTGVASSEGAGIGHNGGEIDYEHMAYIRDDLLAFTYTQVDQIYDPGASRVALINALNDGRSIVNYAGHGGTTYWVTTGFSNYDVDNLTNDNMLPLVVSVGCINGNFDGNTCFGESWLRATNGTAPTGAIAAYMSSINQSWAPPMDAQDELVDLLAAETMITVGGLCYNGSCKMIDLNGSAGVEMYDTWIIFGDPSVQVWHSTPEPWLTIDHLASLPFDLTEVVVDLDGFEGALCILYAGGIIYGRGYSGSDGLATIVLDQMLPIGTDVTLTVTADNRLPYTATLPVVAPGGPYVITDENEIDDLLGGNGDGQLNHGESIILGMQLKNVGPGDAVGVNAVLSSADGFVTIIDADEYFGTIGSDNGTVNIADAFSFDVSPAIPDGHEVVFSLRATDINDSVWVSEFVLTAGAPVIGHLSVIVNDTEENGNEVFDPDETVTLTMILENTGSGAGSNVTAVLSAFDPYITVDDNFGSFGDIESEGGTSENISDGFTASASILCPRGRIIAFELEINDERGYSVVLGFNLTISDREIIFADDFSVDQGWLGLGGLGEWTIGPAAGGVGSDSYGNADPNFDHSPGEDNQVLGNDLTAGTGGDYDSYLSTTYYVTSPPINCLDYDRIVFGYYRWLGVEGRYDNAALEVFDGNHWITLFENDSTLYADLAWYYQEYDLSEAADGNPEFRVRFGIGETDASWNYSGWNIDDLVIKGFNIRPVFVCGDANGDEVINVGDAVLLINYIFKNGPAPDPMVAGDANGDGDINVGDAVHLISHIFKGGDPPQCPEM